MERINFHGRWVAQITSEEGQRDYYNHLVYRNNCSQRITLRKTPTKEDATEYLKLKKEKPSLFGSRTERKKFHKLQEYENSYDWRAIKAGQKHFVGLDSPDGKQLLPNIFTDAFTQFNVISKAPYFLPISPQFVPVSNGKGWALVSLGLPPVLMTEFKYNAIIVERYEQRMIFVQDIQSKKWGALLIVTETTNDFSRYRHTLSTLETIMPCIADEIYEDEIMVDDPEELPSLFFMTRIGDKIGVLTDFGYSKIIYDTYECDSSKCSFRLIRHNRRRARRADWWHPDGKDLFINLIRRKNDH